MKLAYTNLQVISILSVVFLIISGLKFPYIGKYCKDKFYPPATWVSSNKTFFCVSGLVLNIFVFESRMATYIQKYSIIINLRYL